MYFLTITYNQVFNICVLCIGRLFGFEDELCRMFMSCNCLYNLKLMAGLDRLELFGRRPFRFVTFLIKWTTKQLCVKDMILYD